MQKGGERKLQAPSNPFEMANNEVAALERNTVGFKMGGGMQSDRLQDNKITFITDGLLLQQLHKQRCLQFSVWH